MPITNAFKQEAFLSESDEVYLILITIEHADISPSIRVVNNNEDITSNGNLFTQFAFDMELPDSREGTLSRARISIDGVSREISEAIRDITTPAQVTLQVIRASDPDTIERSWAATTLRNVKWDAGRISGDLVFEEMEIEPFPIWQFSPANAPGLFKG